MQENPSPSPHRSVVVVGSFVADVSFRASRLPAWGETLMGSGFALGPGGKGSNQAVAAARAGAHVRMVTKLGDDAFGRLGRDTWAEAGVDATLVSRSYQPTGVAAILVDDVRGENAIVVVPGACFALSPEDVDRAAAAIREAAVLLVQLELPLNTVERALRVAREAGVLTILNPAPAPLGYLPDSLLALAEVLVPNESEAELLTGMPVSNEEEAAAAAAVLLRRGARNVIVTLGERGALVCPAHGHPSLIAAFTAGPCVDTTGAGDAFCGALAAALAEGKELLEAARFGCAGAALSVTRPGTAPSMPGRQAIDALLGFRQSL